MRRAQSIFALALGLGISGGGCAAIAGLEDWQLGSIDASDDAGGQTQDAGGADGATDAGDGGGTDADGGDAGCRFGCPRVAYDFNVASGTTLADVTGHGNNGTLQNGPIWAAGVAGGALSFDGVDDAVDVPASPSVDISGTGLSILFWVNIDDSKAGGDDVIVNKAWAAIGTFAPPYYQYGVEFSAGSSKTLNLYMTVGAGTLLSGYAMKPAVSVWTHAAFTFDGTTVKGYLDGVEKVSTAASGAIASRPATGLRLGVDGLSAQPFKGLLDDLRIYDRALSAAEIAALRDAH